MPRCFMTQDLLETAGNGEGNVAGGESRLKWAKKSTEDVPDA